jgi:hypothetical protein
MKRPASLFNVQGGEIVVDEKFLAAKPGPSPRMPAVLIFSTAS